ncbi:unnamed protein product [Ectocarpus sp. CCAP 1310/34]|nr:unnamed protein product [Ectocarpus sp. CCAP 1310/34]
MGVKGDLKAARARMQAGEPSEAFSMIQNILDSSHPDLKDAQTLYAVLVTSGLAALASQDLTAAESSFRRAADSIPDAPQPSYIFIPNPTPKAWKGLIDCLERSGAEKVAALPECLSRAAEIAEGKGNFARARGLRLRLGTVLDHLGRKEEALEAVLRHVDSPQAMAATAGDGSGVPTAATERLSLLLLAAVLETDEEQAAVARRVEKRLAKDNGGGGGISSTASGTSTAGSSSSSSSRRATALAFDYRAKALAKDDDSAEGGGRVAKRLSDAMEALLDAGQSPAGEDGSGLMTREGGSDVGGDAGGALTPDNVVLKPLVARFCRAYLGRAVHRAEAAAAAAVEASTRWREVLAACARVESAVRVSGWDDGWAATATLLASTYALPNHQRGAAGNGEDDNETTAALLELRRIARGGAQDEAGGDNADGAAAASPRRPWLKSEACLHLAGLALWAGDISQADAHLKTAAESAVAARIPPHRGSSTKQAGAPWAGALSGPGSDWRELSLRCLVDERLGDGGGDPAAAAALGLGRVDAAMAAFDESSRLRGKPDGEGDYADVLGRLGLARASLLLKLGGGRLEEARAAVEMASAGAVHVARQASAVADDGICRPPSLYCRALCVASDVDLAGGEREQAKGKLREALEAEAGFGDALSRLGWLLLGFGGGGAASGGGKRAPCEREDVEAARPLLERAVAEEPGCSSHAFRLARCYWEVGGLYREDRKYCFNSLLKAAKLDPANAEAYSNKVRPMPDRQDAAEKAAAAEKEAAADRAAVKKREEESRTVEPAMDKIAALERAGRAAGGQAGWAAGRGGYAGGGLGGGLDKRTAQWKKKRKPPVYDGNLAVYRQLFENFVSSEGLAHTLHESSYPVKLLHGPSRKELVTVHGGDLVDQNECALNILMESMKDAPFMSKLLTSGSI